MKKFYVTKPAIFASAFLALVMVACGLAITSIDVKSEVETGEEFVMTVNLNKASTDPQQWAWTSNNWIYFGVRVPESWSATKLVATDTGDNASAENNTLSFENSEAYAKVLEFSFPCADGYKWVAFQSVKQYDIVCEEGVTAAVTLVVGETLGKFNLDVVAGGSTRIAPTDMLKENGEVNLNVVYGNNVDGGAALSDAKDALITSEYIMNFGTISNGVIADRINYFKQNNITATVAGQTLPIQPSIANIYNKPVTVTVTKSTGIESVVADSSVEVNAGEGCVNVVADGMVTATIYNVAGRMIDSAVVNGEATLRAEKGVCLVVIAKNGKETVKKVLVK